MRFFFSIFLLCFSFYTVADESAIDQRIAQEKNIQEVKFSIISHKPNYLLPFTFNQKIQSYDVYKDTFSNEKLQQIEMKFQISFKIPLVVDIADLPISVYFGYTQVSFWQSYNTANSSPFRETNYEPEILSVWSQDKKVGLGWKFKLASLSLTHQSNGRSEPISRSWNRIESNLLFEKGNLTIAINPWLRFQESASEDNNPDLLDYYGHGKIYAFYKRQDNTFSLISRNNLESGFSKGSIEFAWSFPIHGRVRGYFQVFSGYGNSLIEYNEYTNTIGLGISLTDWL